MKGKDYDIYHSCRSIEHLFAECHRKRYCPWCVDGILKCFEVEKEGNNKGQLFKTCSNDCEFLDWVKKEEVDGEFSTIKEVKNPTVNDEAHELPSMFDSSLARIVEKRNIKISLNVTFRKGKEPSEDNENERGLHDALLIVGSTFSLYVVMFLMSLLTGKEYL